MPGKQMAIDAELRSGITRGRRTAAAAARAGEPIYGSMDGAMKFVKGDVIASLVITVINILGGLAIGVGQKGSGSTR
jgi:type III secretory pathway component EscV